MDYLLFPLNAYSELIPLFVTEMIAIAPVITMVVIVLAYCDARQYFRAPHIGVSHHLECGPNDDELSSTIAISNIGSAAFLVDKRIRLTAVDRKGKLLVIQLKAHAEGPLMVESGETESVEYTGKSGPHIIYSGFFCYEIKLTNSKGEQRIKKYLLMAKGQSIGKWENRMGRLFFRVSPWLGDWWFRRLSSDT